MGGVVKKVLLTLPPKWDAQTPFSWIKWANLVSFLWPVDLRLARLLLLLLEVQQRFRSVKRHALPSLLLSSRNSSDIIWGTMPETEGLTGNEEKTKRQINCQKKVDTSIEELNVPIWWELRWRLARMGRACCDFGKSYRRGQVETIGRKVVQVCAHALTRASTLHWFALRQLVDPPAQ